jgi:hypothetical protein
MHDRNDSRDDSTPRRAADDSLGQAQVAGAPAPFAYPTSAGLARLMAALVSGTDRDPTTFVTRCGWCRRFELEGHWVDLDEAATGLGFDEDGSPPTITHGICEPCVAAFSRALDEA